MMSQNRQSELDRERAVADYLVGLRAEADFTLLHEKLHPMRERQLMEITDMPCRARDRTESVERQRSTT